MNLRAHSLKRKTKLIKFQPELPKKKRASKLINSEMKEIMIDIRNSRNHKRLL